MDKFCLYHKITNQKNSQKYGIDTTKRSSSKRNSKSFLQNSTKILSEKHQPQFNDYTIYPNEENSKLKKVKLDFKKVSDSQSLSNIKKKTLKTSRFLHSFDQEYFGNEQKSFRTAKSLKHSKQNMSCSHSRINQKNHKKENYAQLFYQLESQIQTLNQKIETCQTESKKSHFEFVLLRDIVEKLRIQNLELSSKFCFFEEFIRKSMKKNLENQYHTHNQQLKHFKDQQTKIIQSEQTEQKVVSKIDAETNFFFQKEQINNQESAKQLNFKNSQSTKILVQTQLRQNNQNSNQPSSPKPEEECFGNNLSIKNQISQATSKKKILFNTNSTVKRNKPKKIYHFENIFKEERKSEDFANQGTNQMIDKILARQNFDKIQPQSSLNVSEENLLESTEIIKVSGQKLTNEKPIFTNSPKVFAKNFQKEDTSITYDFLGQQSPSKTQDQIRKMKKEKFEALNQVQNQYKQLIGILESLKNKQKDQNFNQEKVNQIRVEKERVKKIIEALLHTYNLSV